MKKSLRKPDRWQDFEDLCKKLFGEIWLCPYTIKKNGRQGQPQCGVDIYAIPQNEDAYFGIQCKGKDEYTHAQLTKKEIDVEIAKAKKFKPELKSFIFTTTANKDSEIEEYIRLKDLESKKNGGFQILLYCWEDLVDFIEENRNVFNWYVNSQQFKDSHKLDVTFETGKSEFIIEPKFIRKVTKYCAKPPEPVFPENSIQKIICDIKKRNESQQFVSYCIPKYNILGQPTEKNLSWCSFKIVLKNSGSKVIEDWKFFLWVEPQKYRLIDDNSDKSKIAAINHTNLKRSCWVDSEEGMFKYIPYNNATLIQMDTRSFIAHIIPIHDAGIIKLTWKILARDYNDSGELNLIVKPNYETKRIFAELENIDFKLPDDIEFEEIIVPV
jgi:hypothetical protein